MALIPMQDGSRVSPGKNPTLIPNFGRPVASGSGTVDLRDPASFIANDARTAATCAVTVGGSITNGDTVTLTVTLGTLSGGSRAVTYPVVTADTTTTVAAGVANAVNNDPVLQAAGITATMGGTSNPTRFVLNGGGTVGNFAVGSASVSGGATETFTFANSGSLTGGAGPIIVADNFNWAFSGGGTTSFFFGNAYDLGFDVVTQMVNQGMPIL